MLQLSADALNTGVNPDEQHERRAPETDLAELNRQLALINFKASLNQAESPATALGSLARLIYGSTAVSIFLQREQGWSNGELVLTSGRSMIETAAASGDAVTSANRTITAVDENLVTELGTRCFVAVPVCLSASTDSCAAVAAVGVEEENSADHPTALFQDVARHILSNPAVPSINRDDIVQRARELIHEANNPLSTVQNYLKILSLKLGAEHDAQVTLDSISAELYRTADIIEQFRHLDQPPEAVDEATDVNSIIEQQAALFGKSAQNIAFRLKLDHARPLASIQNAALKQVIVNLFKNAVEAMAGDGEISMESRGGLRQGAGTWVEISVTDNGPGIDDTLGDIFQPGTTSRDGDHRGQGLGVTKKLIEAAGGYLSYRSNPGATEFRLTLPQIQEFEQ